MIFLTLTEMWGFFISSPTNTDIFILKTTMGCNCKGGKPQVLNNLESKDHLQLAFDAYNDVVSKYEINEYGEADAHQVINAFYSIYPNVKTKVSIEHASSTIKHIYETQYGK